MLFLLYVNFASNIFSYKKSITRFCIYHHYDTGRYISAPKMSKVTIIKKALIYPDTNFQFDFPENLIKHK